MYPYISKENKLSVGLFSAMEAVPFLNIIKINLYIMYDVQ